MALIATSAFFSGCYLRNLAPCGFVTTCKQPTFKMTVSIQGFQPSDDKVRQRPFVIIEQGGRIKQTEVGDWAATEQMWLFNEDLTLEVQPDDEVCLSLMCVQEYDLLVASMGLQPTNEGQAHCPVKKIIPEFELAQTEIDGDIWTSKVKGIDLLSDGMKIGRLYVSFQSSRPMGKAARNWNYCKGDDREMIVADVEPVETPWGHSYQQV